MKIDRLGKIFFISLIIILTLHSLAFAANKTSVSASKNLEHAFSIPAKLSLTYTDSTFTKKGGISVQSDDYDIDGRNSAVFLSNGAKLTLIGTSTITTTSANHSHGIYVYKNDANDTTAILNGTAITINSDYSAGVMANGGIISADSVKITTSGDSSPAVRVGYNDSDVKISNSTLVTKGKNSPVIMFNSLNSPSEITISKSTLTASHTSSDLIAVKDNSQAAINFSGVTFGGTVSVDEGSELTINLKNKSTFNGEIKTSGDVNIYVELGSTWNLTGDSYVASLDNEGYVVSNDYAVYVGGNTESEDIINYDEPVAPTITTTGSLKSGHVDSSYSATLKATGTEPITWSIYSGSLPDGLELDEDTGEISGTPTTIKSYSFVVQAENEAGTATKGLTINIAKALISPTITTTELTTATVNKNYSFTLKATGSSTITWSADVLPDGMTLTTAGVLKGKPTAIGEYTITFTASNGAGDDTAALTFKVNGISPTISGTVPNGLIGSEYLATFTITGESVDVATSGGLPAGLSFDVSDDVYVLTGIPTEEWNKKFTVTAENDWGTVSKTYDLIIKAVKPKFLTSSLASGDINSTYSSDIEYEGTIPTITITGLPEGITSSDNGNAITLSGTPTKSGTFTVRVTLKNSAGSVSKSFKMIIYETPTIITTSYDVTINSNFSLTLKATGTTPIKWEADSDCPVTLTSLGVLKGKLTSTGTNTFTITAANSLGTDTKTFILTGKNPKPTLTGTLKQGYVDVDYSATFKANGNGDITITCDSTLPAGLTFTDSGDKTASITGTPAETFKDKISVTAMTSDGVTTTKIFTLNVKEIKPTIVTKALNSGMINESYENGIEVTGTQNGLSVTVTGLPDGLTFDGEKISGTPKQSGKFTVKIVAKNNIGTATKSLKLNIYAPPSINTIELPDATEGKSYSKKFTATGTTPIKWKISDGTLPEGMKFSTSGTLSGKPTEFGDFNFTVTASNDYGTDNLTCTLTVKSVPPKITTSSLKRGTEDKDYGTVTLRATGTKPITWEVDGLPSGLDLEPDTGKITGTPIESGTFNVTITAKNAADEETSKTLTMTIAASKNSTSKSISKSLPTELKIQYRDDKANKEVEDIEILDEVDELEIVRTNYAEEHQNQIQNKYQFLSVKDEIPEDFIKVAELGIISADEDGLYDFEVVLSEDAEIDSELLWLAFPQDVEDSEDDEICEFYDVEGEEIDSVPEDRIIKISVWLEEGIIYKPVIAAKKNNLP